MPEWENHTAHPLGAGIFSAAEAAEGVGSAVSSAAKEQAIKDVFASHGKRQNSSEDVQPNFSFIANNIKACRT